MLIVVGTPTLYLPRPLSLCIVVCKKNMSQGRREANQAAALQQYTLQGVRETGDELGRGSYAAVYTVQYKGLTCAAKKLHQALYEQGIGYAARRFQKSAR